MVSPAASDSRRASQNEMGSFSACATEIAVSFSSVSYAN